jgi:HSP20 family protein
MQLSRRRKSVIDDFYAIDRVFEEAFEHAMWDISRGRLEPLAYLKEAEDKITVSVDLPFVKKNDITLNLTEDTLEIDANLRRCLRFERWGTIQRRCEFKSFYRVIRLPSKVVTEEAKARFEGGILTIELPKRTKQYRIEIE